MANKKHEDTVFRILVSTLDVKFIDNNLKISNLFFSGIYIQFKSFFCSCL